MPKYIKKFNESNSQDFEKQVVDRLLKIIEDNQEYLTKAENLPQLAKLGYMFNALFYTGRICYGFDGAIKKEGSCENNPRYELEDGDKIDYINR